VIIYLIYNSEMESPTTSLYAYSSLYPTERNRTILSPD